MGTTIKMGDGEGQGEEEEEAPYAVLSIVDVNVHCREMGCTGGG